MSKDYTAGISFKTKALRAGIHIPAGVILILACMLGWQYALVALALFSIYEINEDKHLHDMAFLDIAGALIGAFGTIVVLFLLRCF